MLEKTAPFFVGPYRVDRFLDRGGMGEVYLGYDGRLERPVALKRVKSEAAGSGSGAAVSETARARLRREARAAARLSHTAIVQVYDWVETEDGDWIVMEWVDGRPLQEVLSTAPLALPRVLALAREILAGLSVAHEAGIVHRDLKAANLMLTAKGEVKILDFGLAKRARDAESEETLSAAGRILGTVSYMSPEQALGHSVDARSDLFSLGTLLYEMVTGLSPFRGENQVETLTRICTLSQPSARRQNPEVPESFSSFLDDLLRKDPDRRLADAGTAIAVLERIEVELASAKGSDSPVADSSEGRSTRTQTVGWGATTRQPLSTKPAEVPALTLVCHFDPRRVGERALLPELRAGSTVALSRMAPDFAAPGAVWGRPLEDPYLSRKPVLLRGGEDGSVLLEPASHPGRIRIDGTPIPGELLLAAEKLRSGVLIELAERIVLLLHVLSEEEVAVEGPPPADRPPGEDRLGASGPILRLRSTLQRAAELELPVLIRGEAGTGKDVAARELHRLSSRAEEPFVKLRLGALPSSRAVAELCGRADEDGNPQGGGLSAAGRGTLFLDEVGDTPRGAQALLLRLLETGTAFPAGAKRTHHLEARLLAATRLDLLELVEKGRFEETLYHRLTAYEIVLPPLSSRRDDLARLFFQFVASELHSAGESLRFERADPGAPMLVSTELLTRLLLYPWPGNVRQLGNVARQLVIDSHGRDPLPEDLKPFLKGSAYGTD